MSASQVEGKVDNKVVVEVVNGPATSDQVKEKQLEELTAWRWTVLGVASLPRIGAISFGFIQHALIVRLINVFIFALLQKGIFGVLGSLPAIVGAFFCISGVGALLYGLKYGGGILTIVGILVSLCVFALYLCFKCSDKCKRWARNDFNKLSSTLRHKFEEWLETTLGVLLSALFLSAVGFACETKINFECYKTAQNKLAFAVSHKLDICRDVLRLSCLSINETEFLTLPACNAMLRRVGSNLSESTTSAELDFQAAEARWNMTGYTPFGWVWTWSDYILTTLRGSVEIKNLAGVDDKIWDNTLFTYLVWTASGLPFLPNIPNFYHLTSVLQFSFMFFPTAFVMDQWDVWYGPLGPLDFARRMFCTLPFNATRWDYVVNAKFAHPV